MGRGAGRETDGRVQAVLDQAASQHSCATTTDAAIKRALLRRVKSGSVVSPANGLFVSSTVWESLQGRIDIQHEFIMRGLARLHPSWTFCGPSAAVAHDLPVSFSYLNQIHVLAHSSSGSRKNSGVRHHRSRGAEIVTSNGLKITSLEDTALDCIRDMGFRDGLAIADRTASLLGFTAAELEAELRKRGYGLPRIKRALFTACHADALAESGGESIARATMAWYGFVMPRLQIWIDNPIDPAHPFRVDFLWILPDGTVVIGELDGMEKRQNPSMTRGRGIERILADEFQRDSRLSMTGARIMHFGYADVASEQKLVSLLDAYGVPRADSPAGRLMSCADSAMRGGKPASNGAVIRNGRLVFEHRNQLVTAA